MKNTLTVDKALRIYTDKLNAKKKISIRWFERRMNLQDFKEFNGLYPFIALLKTSYAAEMDKDINIGFDEIMERLDKEVNRLYWENHGKV